VSHAERQSLCHQSTYNRRTQGKYSINSFTRTFFLIISICVKNDACLQAEGHRFEHLLSFKVRTTDVLTFISDDKYSLFTVTSSKNGLQVLSYSAGFIGENLQWVYESMAVSYDENPA
jgi:hypothetical protein